MKPKLSINVEISKDILISLSLSNLCFLNVWRSLIFADGPDAYWVPTFTSESYLAVILNVFLLAAVLFAILRLLVRSGQKSLRVPGQLFVLALLIFPASYVRLALGINAGTVIWMKDHMWLAFPSVILMGVLALFLVVYRLQLITDIVRIASLVLFPFALLNLGEAAWSAASSTTFPKTSGIVTQESERPKQRVLWLLLDGLDFRLTFQERPPGLELPELDRLKEESFFATNALSHSRNTKEAVPSFLLQKIVERAQPVSENDMELEFSGVRSASTTMFSSVPNFFTEAASRGARIAIVGYYHPYCRLFRAEYDYCRDFADRAYSLYATNDLIREVWFQVTGITPVFTRLNAVSRYREARKAALETVIDSRFDVVYFHASVPHAPTIWDAKRNRFILLDASKSSYFDNVVLADRLLGDVRRVMEDAGVWDNTVVLLTSDHEWRFSAEYYDGRRVSKIPFLLKLSGQTAQYEFEPTFSPMKVTKDLLLRILGGDIATPQAVDQLLVNESG